MSQDALGLHAEPFMAVNPLDSRNLLAASMVSTTLWKQPAVATFTSFDGGATWHSNGAVTLPAGTVAADDVTVAFDGQGRGFICAMATSQLSSDDRGTYVWRTDDGGRTFTAPTAVVTSQFVDHPWLAAGTGPGALHIAWVAEDHGALGYTRSADGEAFETPRSLQGTDDQLVDATMTAAGPDGRVSVVYGANLGLNGDKMTHTVRVVSSTDAGANFAAPVDLGQAWPRISLENGVIANSGPAIALAPTGGATYAAFTTYTAGSTHSDIAVTASYDDGATWTAPVTATPADDVVYFQPQLVVDGDGHVVLTAFALSEDLIDVVLFSSPGKPLRFGPPRRVTSTPFDPSSANDGNPKHGAWWIGDYQALVATPGAVRPLWNDTRAGGLELFTAYVSDYA